MSNIDQYLEMTGQDLQDLQELLSGEQQYGPAYIDDLVNQALKEKKKIVFVPEKTDGEELGMGTYELQPL